MRNTNNNTMSNILYIFISELFSLIQTQLITNQSNVWVPTSNDSLEEAYHVDTELSSQLQELPGPQVIVLLTNELLNEYLADHEVNYTLESLGITLYSVVETRKEIHTVFKTQLDTINSKFEFLYTNLPIYHFNESETMAALRLGCFFHVLSEKVGNVDFKKSHNWFVRHFLDFLCMLINKMQPICLTFKNMSNFQSLDVFETNVKILIQACRISLDLVEEHYDFNHQSGLNLVMLVGITNSLETISGYIINEYLRFDNIITCLNIMEMVNKFKQALILLLNLVLTSVQTEFWLLILDEPCECGFYDEKCRSFAKNDGPIYCTMCLGMFITETYSLDR
ncbi:hypothetical protein THOM_3126 [Trachipleistophora hominis]|uniref:Uncharacterized protein n=1 Tax=Trachipleistophora hominis TaxID=72359 RepID=L7JRL3_TRAHO|nr:hypothetical protein THOM_3126 [Trachipleistophora hominis]